MTGRARPRRRMFPSPAGLNTEHGFRGFAWRLFKNFGEVVAGVSSTVNGGGCVEFRGPLESGGQLSRRACYLVRWANITKYDFRLRAGLGGRLSPVSAISKG